MRKVDRIRGAIYIVTLVTSALFCCVDVGAASENELYKKAMINAMKQCYTENYMRSSVKVGGTGAYSGFGQSILLSNSHTKNGNGYIYIPTSIGDGNEIKSGASKDGGTQIGCYELFLGDGLASGLSGELKKDIFDLFGKTVPSSSSDSGLVDFLSGMGYTELESTQTTKKYHCIKVSLNRQFDVHGGGVITPGAVCFDETDLDGSIRDSFGLEEAKTMRYYKVNNEEVDSKSFSVSIQSGAGGPYLEISYTDENGKIYQWHGNEVSVNTISDGAKAECIEALADKANSSVSSYTDNYDENDTPVYFEVTTEYFTDEIVSGDTSDATKTYRMKTTRSGVYTEGYNKAYKYLTGNDARGVFSDNEMFDLYSLYLTKVYEIEYADGVDCLSEKPDSYSVDGKYYVYASGKGWCAVGTKNSDKTVSGFTNSGLYELNTYYDFDGLIKAMYALNIDTETISSITNPDTEEEEETEASCYDRGGSLGWIFCPIIESASSAIQDIYSKFIEPFLVLETDLFSGNNGTYNAWNQFRNIANIIFVIFFVVVIFSQLTGIGIDNYGIKKILPKLIVGAILINLSYIICQLAIDIANIVGYSVGGLFQSMGEDIDYGTISLAETGGETLKAVGSYGILTALIALITTGAILSMGVAILVPVLMAVISVLCAIFFCFVLLGVRKAFAVILVVVSPLAFACYMLPNTQPIFKKWYNAFKGVLLAFPICSAMIYGGQMVARIMVSASDNGVLMPFVIALSAAVISVVPIFMIPKVLSSSMAAISGITGRIAGMQKGLTGRAQGKFDKSGAAEHLRRTAANPYKLNKETGKMELKKRARAQDWLASKHLMSKQRLAENRERAVYDEAKRGNVVDKWGGENGLQRAQDVYEGAAARREAEEISDIESRIERSDDINNVGSLRTKLADAIHNGDTQEAIALKNVLYRKGENGRNAVGDAIIKAQGQGANQNTLQRLASHAMSNDTASLKANARSQYEFMKETAEGGEKDYADYKTIDKAEKFTAENMATMDDKEINSMIESISNGSASADQKAYAQRAAYDALHNDNISLKGERRTQLEQLAAGYAPADGGGTDSGNADANAGGGSETNAGSGTNTVEHKAWSNLSASEKTRLRNENPRNEGESTTDYMNRLNGVAESTGGFLGGAAPNADGTNGAGSYTPNGRPRAAEGNWLSYYPRQKGESNEQYKARIQHMKDMTKAYQAGYESGSK